MSYQLVVSEDVDRGPSIHIVDSDSGANRFRWAGYEARYLFGLPRLAALLGRPGRHSCAKADVQELALAAAAAHTRLEGLPNLHRRVLALMYRQPGHHHTTDDVTCLLGLAGCVVRSNDVAACLEGLVAWRLLQRIEIDRDNVFYDIDTRPHVHLYCPISRTLRDVPSRISCDRRD